MLFNSAPFIFAFLPVVVLLSCLLLRAPDGIFLRNIFLVAASLFFYGYWNIWFLPLIVLSISLNYIASIFIERNRLRTAVLAVTIVANLLSIGFFKYLLFFADTITDHVPEFISNIVLPIGISFFTFQQIAYVVDIWRKRTKVGTFLNYTLFVSFFPQLIAGPVVRYQEIVPQFGKAGRVVRSFAPGMFLFVVGLFKKVVLADNLADPANAVFSSVDNGYTVGFIDGWLAALCYTFQLYFDFSAYSDMALGLGLMLGFKLPINFNSPYKAKSVVDFWRRWHITLSTFFRDYLYIPLGGNRHGLVRQLIALLVVMILVGFWHGAGWTFLLWGAWHGVLLTISHTLPAAPRIFDSVPPCVKTAVAWSVTFGLVVVGWVIFRSPTIESAFIFLKGMINPFAVTKHLLFDARYYAVGVMIGVSVLVCLLLPNAVQIAGVFSATQSLFHRSEQRLEGAKAPEWLSTRNGVVSYRMVVLLGGMFYLGVTTMLSSTTEFLYFQF